MYIYYVGLANPTHAARRNTCAAAVTAYICVRAATLTSPIFGGLLGMLETCKVRKGKVQKSWC
jgi:hypothetical protein